MKRAGTKLTPLCVSCIILGLCFAGISYAKIDPQTVAAVWLFDEGSGKVAKDSSGNGNDADITNAKWADGKFGKALSFEGSGFAEAKTFDNTDGKFQTHTYVLWAKQEGAGSEIPFNAGAARVMNVHFNEAPGRLLVGWAGMPGDWIRVDGVWTPGQWHHVAVTHDGKKMFAYLDMKVVGERATNAFPPAETGSFLMGRFLGGGYFLRGLIDEVAVFTVALTEADIKGIMERGFERALGITPVEPAGKLATAWGKIKTQ
jgi:hypothetical protein